MILIVRLWRYTMMTQTEFKWMPHHEGAIPPSAQGERISTYNVALEGWRRGLKLEFYSVFEEETKQKLRYSLSNEKKTHHFQLSMGDKVTQEAFDICADKDLTKQYLSKAGVPVPEDRKSTRLNSSHVAISYAVFCLKKKTN